MAVMRRKQIIISEVEVEVDFTLTAMILADGLTVMLEAPSLTEVTEVSWEVVLGALGVEVQGFTITSLQGAAASLVVVAVDVIVVALFKQVGALQEVEGHIFQH